MIEVVVEQMHGSDRFSEPEMDYERALDWLRTVYLRERNGALSGVHVVVCSKSVLTLPALSEMRLFSNPSSSLSGKTPLILPDLSTTALCPQFANSIPQ